MKCSCCGNEILSNYKICPYCGQNNESYVAPKNHEQKKPIQQPINRVPIKIQNNGNNQQQYSVQNQNNQSASASVIKAFMILGCISSAFAFIIPLCWTIPMTLETFRCLNSREKMSTSFKTCTLLFCSLIAGLIMLCDDDT